MARKKTASKKKAKKYQLEFSLGTMFFWCLGLFFLLAWIFVLGILVGKGMLSHRMENLSVQEKQPAGPHQAKRGQTSPASDTIMRDMMGWKKKNLNLHFTRNLPQKKRQQQKKSRKISRKNGTITGWQKKRKQNPENIPFRINIAGKIEGRDKTGGPQRTGQTRYRKR